jgi:hypothetical protein
MMVVNGRELARFYVAMVAGKRATSYGVPCLSSLIGHHSVSHVQGSGEAAREGIQVQAGCTRTL